MVRRCYLDVFSLPFSLTRRERAFVVGGVRAERTPHAQPEESPGELTPERTLLKSTQR